MAGNTLDTIDRGETIHPGVARGGTSTDNAAGTETRASWHGRTVRSVGPPKRGTPWGLFAVLLLVGGAIAAFFVVPRGGSQEPGFEIKVLPEELSITAGESQTLFVEFQRTQFEDEIDVRVGPPPDDVTIELAEGSESSDTRTYTVNVHLNAPPTTTELLVEARGGDLQRSRTVPLRVKSVPGWLPDTPEGFEESGPKKRAAGRIYYERIRRQIPGELPVDFVLVDEPGEVPFYIMANKAWNGLFAAFAEEVADFRDPLRAKEDPGWDLEQARANPLLPATNLTVVEANRFGRWLAGKYADLPTHDEWDIAAGYRRIRHDPADQEFLLFTNASAAAVGGKRLPVDRVSADKSVYGCRDMAGNGYEWTRSIFYNQGRELDEGVPIEDVSPLFGDIDSVIYRGQSFAAPEPLTFADLTRQITKEPRMNPISLSSEDIGFRIVIRPPAVRSSD